MIREAFGKLDERGRESPRTMQEESTRYVTPRGGRRSQVTANRKVKKGDSGRISGKNRCTHFSEDGKRCKQKAWRAKKVCYQHDPAAAELRRKAGRPRNPVPLTTVEDVQESLAETMRELQAGKIKPGQAYAAGYLAQLALTALELERKQSKLDVKHFWEVVDLGAAFEKAGELAKERRKGKEAQEASPSASPQDKEAEEKAEEAEAEAATR